MYAKENTDIDTSKSAGRKERKKLCATKPHLGMKVISVCMVLLSSSQFDFGSADTVLLVHCVRVRMSAVVYMSRLWLR